MVLKSKPDIMPSVMIWLIWCLWILSKFCLCWLTDNLPPQSTITSVIIWLIWCLWILTKFCLCWLTGRQLASTINRHHGWYFCCILSWTPQLFNHASSKSFEWLGWHPLISCSISILQKVLEHCSNKELLCCITGMVLASLDSQTLTIASSQWLYLCSQGSKPTVGECGVFWWSQQKGWRPLER